MSIEYRIAYVIESRRTRDQDFEEIGSGNTLPYASVDEAWAEANESIRNGTWMGFSS
ncbi:hypothetical protein MycrhDRAFT_5685 [Mycolicibacterium rhodesiae JS60]|nr:hypothetical protein MycrhDRAFT_5685 [Mycolicibacterium rhodesiae JS60]